MRLCFQFLALLSISETTNFNNVYPLIPASNLYSEQPIFQNIVLNPLSENATTEISPNEAVSTMMRYVRCNILNENEKLNQRQEYFKAITILNNLISSKVQAGNTITSTNLAAATEALVQDFAGQSLDNIAAEMLSNLFNSNFEQMWDSFSMTFKQKYLNSILAGLCRFANVQAVQYILSFIPYEIQGSLAVDLIKPACWSGHKFMVDFIVRNAPDYIHEDEIERTIIESLIVMDAEPLLHYYIMKRSMKQEYLMNWLKLAVRSGSKNSVNYLIQQMEKSFMLHPDRNSILLETLENKNYQLMNCLSSFLKISFNKNILLREACSRGLKDAVEILLSRDEKDGKSKFPLVDPTDANNDAIIKAGTFGHLDIIKLLIEQNKFREIHGLPLIKLHARQNELIIEAAINHNFHVVDYLLQNKRAGLVGFQKIDLADSNWRLMQHAFRTGDLQLIEFLVKADQSDKRLRLAFNIGRSDPNVLVEAMKEGHCDAIEYILQEYPDLDLGRNNNELLHAAILYRRTNMVKELLKKDGFNYFYGGIDPAYDNNKGLKTAVENDFHDIVKLLLKCSKGTKVHPNVEVTAKRSHPSSTSVFEEAINRGNYKVLRIIYAQDNEGTSIHLSHIPKIYFEKQIPEKSLINLLRIKSGLEEDHPMHVSEVVEKSIAFGYQSHLPLSFPYISHILRTGSLKTLFSMLISPLVIFCAFLALFGSLSALLFATFYHTFSGDN